MSKTLGKRITIGCGIVLALLGVIVLLSYRNVTQSLADLRGVLHTHAVLERLTLRCFACQ